MHRRSPLLFFLLSAASFSALVDGRLSATVSSMNSEFVEQPRSQQQQRNKAGLLIYPLIPGDSPEMNRRRLERQRRRQLHKEEEEKEEDESPLTLHRDILYEGYGTHYVDLYVGCDDPQRVTVIVDTGSSFTGFPCSGCSLCGGKDDKEYHLDDYYNPSKSSCFQVVTSNDDCWLGKWEPPAKDNEDEEEGTCRASARYSEGSSWTAYEATDTVYSGGDHKHVDEEREDHESFNLHFGCQDQVTGLFKTQLADGIMGMKIGKTSFWNQMYSAGKMEQAAFSLCFSKPGHVERKGTLAGAMVLGGSDTRLHTTEMVYAKQMANNGKYVVHLEKVYLQDAATGNLTKVQISEEDLNNRGEVIVDSGTTSTYLTTKLGAHFIDVFNDMVPKDIMQLGPKDEYHHLTPKQLESLPTIVFQMKGSTTESIQVAMPPSHYLANNKGDQYYMDILFSEGSGRGGVLGANLMRGHDVLFDIDNDRIGFAESDCEYKNIADDEDQG